MRLGKNVLDKHVRAENDVEMYRHSVRKCNLFEF